MKYKYTQFFCSLISMESLFIWSMFASLKIKDIFSLNDARDYDLSQRFISR